MCLLLAAFNACSSTLLSTTECIWEHKSMWGVVAGLVYTGPEGCGFGSIFQDGLVGWKVLLERHFARKTRRTGSRWV